MNLNCWLDDHKKTFLIFALVGGTTAVLNLGMFSVFWRLWGLNYLLAITLSYCLAVVFHFNMNRRFTFKSHGANLGRHFLRYLVLLGVNLILNLIVIYFCVNALLLSPFYGAVLATGIGMMVSYAFARFWVFT